MEFIPIAGGALAFVGLVMMAVAAVMFARGGKRQVKVVIPTSTAGKMPPPVAKEEPKPAPPPPPPAPPKPEPPKPEPPKPEPPKVAVPPPPPPPKDEAPKPAPPPPPPPPEPPRPQAPEVKVDPSVSEEGTRIAMIPPPEELKPSVPPPPEEATIAQPIPTAPTPATPEDEAPQSTIAISAGDMDDFRTIVEQEAPKSYGSLVGLSGGMQGREARIDEEGFVIGRDQRTAQLVISDPRISKRHVWVGVRDGEVWAIDVGSTNGTYLNVPKSERITEVRLSPGDILILAEDAARFEYRG